MSPRHLYTERLATLVATAQRLRNRERTISIVRLLVIIAAIAIAFWNVTAALVPIVIFIVLVIVHERRIVERKHAESGAAFYRRGLARIDGNWQGLGDSGSEFAEEHHPYAGDFDLFGRGSLFELISIAVTRAGRARLAAWLKEPARTAGEIASRQTAVLELRDNVTLREDLAVEASEVTHEIESAKLDEWAAMAPARISAIERVVMTTLPITAILLIAVTLPSLIGRLIGWTHPEAVLRLGLLAEIPSWPLVLAILATATIARQLSPRVAAIVFAVERAEPAFALLGGMLARIERESFTSERLRSLKTRLRGDRDAASKEIERLRRLVALLDARRNQFFAPFALLLLWTPHVAMAIERWRVRSGAHVRDWIEAVGQTEALASLASFAYEHPTFAMPQIMEGRRSAVGSRPEHAVGVRPSLFASPTGDPLGVTPSLSASIRGEKRRPDPTDDPTENTEKRRPDPEDPDPLAPADLRPPTASSTTEEQRPDPMPLFEARGLGHPLIPGDRRVTNDVRLDDTLRLLVVSGSNMSGKSTMMRSVGIGAVLAMAGGPVCAHALRIAPMAVGASIRVDDSLQENASRFYAEILRIRLVLEMSKQGPLLFLLDEILAGTNSHDRRIGADAIVRGLVERGAIGMVSTHDLALAQIADALAPRAANVHFEDHIEDGRVVFDYRMRPGIVTKSNALQLMRSVGIEV